MPLVGFEPTISVAEGLQTYALDRAVIGTGEPQYCFLHLMTPNNLYYIILYYIILYYIILYYIILYYTILYYIILYYINIV